MTGLPQPTAPRLRFGVFELDVCAGELHRNGWKVRLEGQPLAILGLLLKRAGEMVSREELRRELWPADTYVDFEHSINAAVKRLREALEDRASAPRYVETLPRRGYRFIFPLGNGDEKKAGEPPRSDLRPGLAPARSLVKMGDVARHFGVSAGLLRQYEREGLLIPLRYRKNRLYFTDQDYRWICTLLHLVRQAGLNFEGIRRLLALLPCWQIRGCEHRRKQGCPFIKRAHAPCWTNKRACCGGGESCYSCPVYRSAPECENLKSLLAGEGSAAHEGFPDP